LTTTFGIIAMLAALGAPADSGAARAPADTAAARRIVRTFPTLEVRAPIHDLRSSQTVRMISGTTLRALPVDGLAAAVALQAGVVAQGEELHVRGGRNGETEVLLDGLGIAEPLRRRTMEVPLLAVRGADLVTGAPDARFGSGLAGTLDVRSTDPTPRFSGEARAQSALHDRWYDRGSARVSGPLGVAGLGFLAAGAASFGGRGLPDPRTPARAVAGLPVRWRGDNRLSGFVRVAPLAAPRSLSAEVLFDRRLRRPYDAMWTLDGWTRLYADTTGRPAFSATPLPGYERWIAADHRAVADERRMAAQLALTATGARRHGGLALGWLRSRALTSAGGARDPGCVYGNALTFGDPRYLPGAQDPLDVVWGDDPLFRRSGSDTWSARAEGGLATRGGGLIEAGAGATLEHATLFELDGTAFHKEIDSLRVYDAWAPGAFAWVQGRADHGGLVVNAGLRGEYFTSGHEAGTQELPGLGRGAWSLSPRLGLAYPLSVRDVFSLAYVRVQQNPGRDFLYDRRHFINQRQPLGNPGLMPATVISYEAAVKHLFSAEWALQGSIFFRNVWGQVGTRNHSYGRDVVVPAYTNDDEASALGFEWGVFHVAADGRLWATHYTYMQAWGNESRPEGDPYGALRDARIAAIADVPLSWDRHHTVVANAAAPLRRGFALSWSTVVGSPLPWTPKDLHQPVTDIGLVNSRRLGWTEVTNVDLRWTPSGARAITLALEARNLFDERAEVGVTVDGYPNPSINTVYDDYSAYRTATGRSGGGYWVDDGSGGHWVAVHDPRLAQEPRSVRLGAGVRW
jgi:outer membrane receptor protein involved in Fe transport